MSSSSKQFEKKQELREVGKQRAHPHMASVCNNTHIHKIHNHKSIHLPDYPPTHTHTSQRELPLEWYVTN